jgi:quercetin dioxygenase-like cupin family protein
MSFKVRRVVTGHDAEGNAIIKRDDLLQSQERLPGYEAMTVWCTREFPVNNDDDAFNDGEPGPKGQRVLMRIGEMQPGANSAELMHRTETLDYAVVLSGECELELETGERIRGLKAGDVVIQRGTNHAWIARGSGPVRFLFVLIDAKPITVGDKVLTDFLDNLGGKISPMPSSET